MTSLNTQLWELISTHKMPDDASGQTFIEQLMDAHRITRDTATVAVQEYRKFMYLCATRTARNVPSQAVDLVWHQHMQHSRDYWDVFCRKIGKPVHHSPGGDGQSHLDDYKATVAAYKRLFGMPPRGIWRHKSRGDQIIAVFISGLFIFFAATAVAKGETLPFSVPFLLFALFSFGAALHSMTPKAEFTLAFESSDPFADDDAGDCGSDGGGCGD